MTKTRKNVKGKGKRHNHKFVGGMDFDYDDVVMMMAAMEEGGPVDLSGFIMLLVGLGIIGIASLMFMGADIRRDDLHGGQGSSSGKRIVKCKLTGNPDTDMVTLKKLCGTNKSLYICIKGKPTDINTVKSVIKKINSNKLYAATIV
jgi:hypothetical protein